MTTPGATEAVTPDEYAAEIWSVLDTDPSLNAAVGCLRHEAVIPYLQRCIANIVREAEANALRRAADMAEAWVSRATQFPREFRYHAECNRAHEEQISGLGAAIRSLLPKEEGN